MYRTLSSVRRVKNPRWRLRWADVDWVTNRIAVHSPKSAHHGDGHAYRVIPLFTELRPYLEALRDEVNPGIDSALGEPVITRYRDSNCNLRTQRLRIIIRAGLQAWSRLFQNLRAGVHPSHVAADWLGQSTIIEVKR